MTAGVPSTTPSGFLLARLRAETAAHHRRIEDVVPLLREDLDLRRYRDYLGRLLGYVAPIEERLVAFRTAFSDARIDLAARRKAPLLELDLAALGLERPTITSLRRCNALPALGSIDSAWGCLYVLEGSTLGGQVIKRTLGPRLELTVDFGLRFLAGYGEQTACSWRAFAEAIGRHERARCDPDAVVRGAQGTFETMTEWLRHG